MTPYEAAYRHGRRDARAGRPYHNIYANRSDAEHRGYNAGHSSHVRITAAEMDTSTIARQTTATWEHADLDTPDYSHRPVTDEALRAALAAEQGMVMIDSHGRLCDDGGSLVSVDCDDRAACRLLGLDYDEVKLRLGL